jgi:lipoyl(octanoyl) transferase
MVRDLGLLPYPASYAIQRQVHAAVVAGAEACLLLVEHPPVITQGRKDQAGTNIIASPELLEALGIALVATERGGSATYHGPGQLVGYPILRVGRRVRDYLSRLQAALVAVATSYGLSARPNPGYAGIYVEPSLKVGDREIEQKLVSIGVAIQNQVSLHGFALNVNTNLAHFELITPCGLENTAMVSLSGLLGAAVAMSEVKTRVGAVFGEMFEDF